MGCTNGARSFTGSIIFAMNTQLLHVIKIGGGVIDNETQLQKFLHDYARIKGKKILVHGGGKMATRIAEQLGIKQTMLEGRRITDAATLKIVTMVYAGYINKSIVAILQSYGCNALGVCGADGNIIRAHKRDHPTVDYGFAGDIDSIHAQGIYSILDQETSLVISPITHDGKGQLLNTNADTIANEVAISMANFYQVRLLYCFEKNGVLKNAEDNTSVINKMNYIQYQQLKSNNSIFAGMIPKLDNAFKALQSGIEKVIIGNSQNLNELISGKSGTTITNDE